jgi:hypothetical protein
MSVPSGGPPHETGIRIAGAGDSVVPVRHVLGTVPVEADGSAHFTVPAHRSIFFQALDENGLAVQSMRSSTYLHEGEHLSCVGCHEPGHRAPANPASRRSPCSGPRPSSARCRRFPPVQLRATGAAGAGPQLRELPPGNSADKRRTWAANRSSGSGTPPTTAWHRNGASTITAIVPHHARPLRRPRLETVRTLQGDHHGLKLSAEDLHRLTLWLDLSSMFYGVYEKERGEAQLRGEVAWPTLDYRLRFTRSPSLPSLPFVGKNLSVRLRPIRVEACSFAVGSFRPEEGIATASSSGSSDIYELEGKGAQG